MKTATMFGVVFAGLSLGGFFLKDNIQTMLFDRSQFVSCFEDEVISELGSQSLINGTLTSGLAGSILGPQVRSNGNQIADFVKKNGLEANLNDVSEDVNNSQQERFSEWQSSRKMPPKDVAEILWEAEEVCLQRQVLW